MNIRCSCIRGNYNVYVKALDKKTLIYQDLSDWMDEPRYDLPETYTVTVIPPGESTGVSLELNIRNTNRISEDDLGCIKDGVWCFQTESCGTLYKRSVGIFYSIECCIRKAYATESDKSYKAIKEVEMFVTLAKSAVSINNIQEATEFLEIAQKKLDRIKCDCNC